MSLTETTEWASTTFDQNPAIPSFGREITSRGSNTAFVNGSRTFCDLAEIGAMISFAASHQKVRYGPAEDAAATTWDAYQSTVTLTGIDATALNNSANFVDGTALQLFNGAAAEYLHATGEVFIFPNIPGNECYRIIGLNVGDTGAVTKLSGSSILTSSVNGTFGRARVIQQAGVTLAIRVSSVSDPVEIMRIV